MKVHSHGRVPHPCTTLSQGSLPGYRVLSCARASHWAHGRQWRHPGENLAVFAGSLISECHVSSPWEQSLERPGGGEHCGRRFLIRLGCGAGSHLKENGEERKEELGSRGRGPLLILPPHPPRTNPAGLRAKQVGRQLVLLLNSSCSPSRVRCLSIGPSSALDGHTGAIWSGWTQGPTAPCQGCRMRLTTWTMACGWFRAGPSQGCGTPFTRWVRAFPSLGIPGSQVSDL